METAMLLHISRHLAYDMQMPRRNSFWIIVFALMVSSFNPTYNGNVVSRFLRCLRFANEVSLVCTILDSFLYENIISWETDKATWLKLVGVASALSISNEPKLKRGNGMDSCWQLTGKFAWKLKQMLVTSNICLRIGRTTFSKAFAGKADLFLLICSLLDVLFPVNCEYVMVFLRSSFWSLNLGRANLESWIVKHVAKREFYLIWEVSYIWTVLLLKQSKIFHACYIVPLQLVLFIENAIPQKFLWWIIWCCSFLLYCCWIFIVKSH